MYSTIVPQWQPGREGVAPSRETRMGYWGQQTRISVSTEAAMAKVRKVCAAEFQPAPSILVLFVLFLSPLNQQTPRSLEENLRFFTKQIIPPAGGQGLLWHLDEPNVFRCRAQPCSSSQTYPRRLQFWPHHYSPHRPPLLRTLCTRAALWDAGGHRVPLSLVLDFSTLSYSTSHKVQHLHHILQLALHPVQKFWGIVAEAAFERFSII